MRVWYSNGNCVDYPTVTHWEYLNDNWLELNNEEGELVTVVNWDYVLYMEPISSKGV